jgi:cellulose biosynthesis protein BcsQ
LKIPFIPIRENVSLLQGSLNLGLYEDLLATSFSSAAAGQPLGYFQTSAISRFLFEKGLDEQIDLFIIDSSPNLGLLNRAILLGTDYFCTPLMPDAFSLQGIQNL